MCERIRIYAFLGPVTVVANKSKHAPNRNEPGFLSYFISSLEKVRKQLESLVKAAGYTICTVINPL